MSDGMQLPVYDAVPVTTLGLLSKAMDVTLHEYGEYHLLDMRVLYQALLFIRVSLEPTFINDETQLKSVYNRIRESSDPITRRQSDIPMRFLNSVLSRWLVYVSDELDINAEDFKYQQASKLTAILTLQLKTHERMDDIMGDTMEKDEWLNWLRDCPIFILIFNIKYLASDYLVYARDLVLHYESVKDNNTNFIPEG